MSFVGGKHGGPILIQRLGISLDAENLERFGGHTSIKQDGPVSFTEVLKNLSPGFDGVHGAKHGSF